MGFVCILFFPINSVNGPVTVTMLQYTVLYSHYSIIKSLYAKISYPLVLEVLSSEKIIYLMVLDVLSYETKSYPMVLEVLSYEKISYPSVLEVLSYEKISYPAVLEVLSYGFGSVIL